MRHWRRLTLQIHTYGIHCKEDYSPKAAFKISLTHNRRNQIRIVPGVANSANDTMAEKTIPYRNQFVFSGGAYPLLGKDMDSTIELGLDVTQLYNFATADSATYFLDIESRGGSGTINSFSFIDYSKSPAIETPCRVTKKSISLGITRISIKVKNRL